MDEFEKIVSVKYFAFERVQEHSTDDGYDSYVECIDIAFPSAETAKNFLKELKERATKVVEAGGSLPYKEPYDSCKSGVIYKQLNYVPFYSPVKKIEPETSFPPKGFEIWDEVKKEYFLDKWSVGYAWVEEEEQ